MSVQESFVASGPMLRIAIPAWRIGHRQRAPEIHVSPGPSREEFQKLMQCEMTPRELLQMRLTKSERRQVSTMRRLRSALYPSSDLV